jgi:FeS assembly SUF system protein
MGLGDMLSRLFKKEEKNREEITEKIGNSREGFSRSTTEEPIMASKLESINKFQTRDIESSPSSDLETEGKEQPSEKKGEVQEVTEQKVLEVLSEVYDPEIPIDIVNLGLIYGIDIKDGRVHVRMTMTAPGCPASAQIAAEAKMLIEEIPGVKEAIIEIVWDPPWDPSMMSEEAKQSLGYI